MADKPTEKEKSAAASIKASKQEIKDIQSLVDQLSKVIGDAFYVDPDKSLSSFKKTLGETVSITEQLSRQQEEILLFGREANKMSSDQIKTLQKQITLNQNKLAKEKETLLIAHKQLFNQFQQAKALGKQGVELDAIHSKIKANEEAQETADKAFEKTVETQKQLNKEFAKAKVGEGAKKGLDKVNGAAKSVGNTIAQAFGISSLNPLEILLELFGFVVKAAIDLDTELGVAAKSMNQTYQAAAKSREAMVDVAQASGELLINSTHIEKTFLELNKTLGTGVAFEKLSSSLQKDIAFMAMMENYAGLTADESNAILKYSLQLGKSAKQTSGILMAQYKASSLKYGVVVNEKDALREVAKLSDAVKLSTVGGAAGLAKALAAAKGLGVSLDEVRDTASSLLNFEDSIEKELAAELLTGKQLNLEKARQAALNNDLVTVAEEIKNQVGSAAEFASMNRIQQEAIAGAVGMTAESLSTALSAQEQQKEISEGTLSTEQAAYDALVAKHGEQGAIGVMMQQQLALQTQQASSQEKIAAAKLKEKDVIAKDILPLMADFNKKIEALLAKIKEIFEMFGSWKSVLIAIGAILAVSIVANIVKMIREMQQAAKVTRSLLAIEKAVAGAEVVGGAAKMSAGLGPAGIAVVSGLIGAGLAALATATMMSDGIISSSSGGSGFGDRVLFGPEGAISFNNKDTIVAGTNLFPKQVNDYASSAGSLQLSNSSKEMSELKEAILALASRPIEVTVGGEAIIKATTGNLPSEAGLAAAKNSFQLQ